MSALVFAASRPDVDMDVAIRGAEHPMAAFANAQRLADVCELRQVARFIFRVLDGHHDVDDRLGRQSGVSVERV
jgi:hypothetical protein